MLLFVEGMKDEVVDEWTKAAKHFGQTVKLGLLDISNKENKQFAEDRYGLSDYPAVRIFKHGKKSSDTTPTHFEGEITSEALITKGNDLLQPGETFCPAITSKTFEPWVSGTPFIPRLILFSDKETVPSMLKAFALEFVSEEVLVGAVLNQPDLVEKYEIKKFPTIVYMQGNPNNIDADGLGSSKIGFSIRHLDLPPKLDYTILQQIGDELADQWAVYKPIVAKKLDEVKEKSEKAAEDMLRERAKSQAKPAKPAKQAKPAKSKKKEL